MGAGAPPKGALSTYEVFGDDTRPIAFARLRDSAA